MKPVKAVATFSYLFKEDGKSLYWNVISELPQAQSTCKFTELCCEANKTTAPIKILIKRYKWIKGNAVLN